MFTKVMNVVIATRDVEKAAKYYLDTFGLKTVRIMEQPKVGVKSAFIPIGDEMIEFIEPFGPEQAPIKKFLETRGEGLYMIELRVCDMDKAITELEKKNVRLIGADPKSRAEGSFVFIHPDSAQHVLIRLCTD